MSRSDHSRPSWYRRCWWCDGHHRSRCPEGTNRAKNRRYGVAGDLAPDEAVVLNTILDDTMLHELWWMGFAELPCCSHRDCEICAVPNERTTSHTVRLVDGVTVTYWSEQ